MAVPVLQRVFDKLRVWGYCFDIGQASWPEQKQGVALPNIYIGQAHVYLDPWYIYLNGISAFHTRESLFRFITISNKFASGVHACNQTVNFCV